MATGKLDSQTENMRKMCKKAPKMERFSWAACTLTFNLVFAPTILF